MKKLTVLFVALAMVFVALPAFAQDKPEYSFYGFARMFTSFESANSDTAHRSALPAGTTAKGWGLAGNLQDDKDLVWTLQSTTQVGMRAKWGDIGGHVQFRESLGVAGQTAPSDYATTTAIFYGTWNFGPGTLLVGRDFSPYTLGGMSQFCGPGAGDCGGVGYGLAYAYRVDQIKLIMGGFQFALINPNRASDSDITAAAASAALTDYDSTLPKIEASYSAALGPAALSIAGAYNTQRTEFANAAGALRDVDINSWALAATAKFAFGPLYFNAGGQYGRNVGNGNFASNLLIKTVAYNAATDSTEDADYLALMGVVGFKVTDALILEGGVMYQQGKQDLFAGAGDVKDSITVYYLDVVWSPAKNVMIMPEFAIIDYGKLEQSGVADIDYGKLTYLGIKWQISF